MVSDSGREIVNKIRDVVQEGVNDGAYPGAVAVVTKDDEQVFLRAFGHASVMPTGEEMKDDMLFDLASVTKVVVTTTSIMTLLDDGKLSLTDKVAKSVPEFGANDKGHVTVRDLLTHTSGLTDWSDLYTRHASRRDVVGEVCSMGLSYPTGKSVLYSDLGFIMLGEVVERVSGEPLDRYVVRQVFEPLGMIDTMFNPSETLTERCVPTEYSNWRLRMVRGEVHDENAFAMGGVSGHAGLFSTARDLHKFAAMVYNRGELNGKRILSSESVGSMTRNQTEGLNESRGLGWLAEPEFTGGARIWGIGHNGYAGTSVAISLERRAFAALLTNRVHPVREGRVPGDKSVGIMMARRKRWTEYLPKFYQLAAEMVWGERS